MRLPAACRAAIDLERGDYEVRAFSLVSVVPPDITTLGRSTFIGDAVIEEPPKLWTFPASKMYEHFNGTRSNVP